MGDEIDYEGAVQFQSYSSSNVNTTGSWPEKIIKTIIFLHSGFVFLSKFGVDLTFAKKIV